MSKKLRSIHVDPPGPILTDETAPAFAETMLSIAIEVRADEARLWAEIERLAAAGDVERIGKIAAHRRNAPPSEVAASWLHSGEPKGVS